MAIFNILWMWPYAAERNAAVVYGIPSERVKIGK